MYYVSNLFKALQHIYYYYIITLYVDEFHKVFISFLPAENLRKSAVKNKALLINSEPVCLMGAISKENEKQSMKGLCLNNTQKGTGKILTN